MGPIWAKLLEHLMQNGRALRDAPLVFLAVLLLACGVAYWLTGLRYQGVLDQKSGTIESLKTQIDGLQVTVRDLQQQLAARSQPQSKQPFVRDPDGVYQLGAQVGSVQFSQIDESKGIVTFGSITGAVKLNTDRDFEYRDLILHIRSIGSCICYEAKC
jgi:hypothetical protein